MVIYLQKLEEDLLRFQILSDGILSFEVGESLWFIKITSSKIFLSHNSKYAMSDTDVGNEWLLR